MEAIDIGNAVHNSEFDSSNMAGGLVGIKRLTKNDLSWLETGSRSHQSGINLPLRQFEQMFPEISRAEGSRRLTFQVFWNDKTGERFAATVNDVVWYSSKNELRLLHVAKVGLSNIAGVGDMLEIERKNRSLEATVLPPRRAVP